jgi:acetylornithine deacetylase
MGYISLNPELNQEARRNLDLLVSHNTVKPNPTRPLAELLKSDLEKHGIDVRLVPSKEEPEKHAGLIARLGPNKKGGIALSGHLDVVPVEGQDWTAPPFQVTEKDGKLYGRGAVDMKGFVANALAGLTHHAGLKKELKKPILLYLSYDEETGFKSVAELLAEEGIPKPRLAIIGEPTGLRVVTAHKAALGVTVEITGRACHSANPENGINAGEIAHEFWNLANAISLDWQIRDGGKDYAANFTPPFSTLSPTVLHTGTAANIIPDKAVFRAFGRPILEEKIEPVFAAFRKEAARLTKKYTREVTDDVSGQRITVAPEIKVSTMGLPPLRYDPKNAAFDFLKAAGIADTRRPEHVSYMTEAAIFQKQGIPAVVYGPGSIDQAHKPDEYILEEQFIRGGNFIDALVKTAAYGSGYQLHRGSPRDRRRAGRAWINNEPWLGKLEP